MVEQNKLPKHVAIIMDGNARWAKQKGLPKIKGHHAGAQAVEEVIRGCLNLGIKVLSLYTFSVENWQRPGSEVAALMRMLERYIKTDLPKLQENKIRLVVSGQLEDLPVSLQQQLQKAVKQTRQNSRLILNLALSYGARQEILQATKAIAWKLKQGKIGLDQINQQLFAQHLYTKDLPDPDLLIRTSGEQRVSNFLLWQISYTEFYFTPKFWPDFKQQDLERAVLDYQGRARKFGV